MQSEITKDFEDAVLKLEQGAMNFAQFVFALHRLLERLVVSGNVQDFQFITHMSGQVDISVRFTDESIAFKQKFNYIIKRT